VSEPKPGQNVKKINFNKVVNIKLEKFNGLIVLIICFIVYLVVGHNTDVNNKARNKYLEENGLYTIGKVIEYSEHIATGGSQYIKISYKVMGIEYQVSSGYNVPFKDGPKAGELFMAMYLPYEPEKCALLYDYPVKDSTDYKRYIEEFKKNPPKLK